MWIYLNWSVYIWFSLISSVFIWFVLCLSERKRTTLIGLTLLYLKTLHFLSHRSQKHCTWPTSNPTRILIRRNFMIGLHISSIFCFIFPFLVVSYSCLFSFIFSFLSWLLLFDISCIFYFIFPFLTWLLRFYISRLFCFVFPFLGWLLPFYISSPGAHVLWSSTSEKYTSEIHTYKKCCVHHHLS